MTKTSAAKKEISSIVGTHLIKPGDEGFTPPSEFKKIDSLAVFLADVEPYRKYIEQFDVLHAQVFVVKYISAGLGAGYLVASDYNKREDNWQGKVGLVMKVGPGAFVDDDRNKFYGKTVKPGDWVVYRNTDGWDYDVRPRNMNKLPCKVLDDTEIKMIVPSPDWIW